MKKKWVGFVWILLITLSFKINAVNYYVNINNGNDLNRGDTWTNAFMSISRAAQMVRAGDNIYIAEGVYYELLAPSYSGIDDYSRITFIGIGKVVIDGQKIRHCVYNTKNYITFENLEFTNNYGYGSPGAAFNNIGNNTIIKKCKFYNNEYRHNYHYMAAGLYNNGVNLIISNSVFYNNKIRQDYSNYYSASCIYSQNRISEIKNCLFYNNQGYSYYNNGIRSAGVIAADVSIFQNNIFMNNKISIIGTGTSSETLYTCVRSYSNYILDVNSSDFNVFYNNIGGDTDSQLLSGKHNLYINPEFADADNYNFYLSETSPLINAGAPDGDRFLSIGPYDVLKKIGKIQNWTGWTDENGSNLSNSNYFEVDINNNVKLKKNIISAKLLSNIIDFSEKSEINKINLNGEIWEKLRLGNKQVIDVDKIYPREIEYRVSDDINNITSVSWKKMVIGGKMNEEGIYLQLRLTLRKNGE